MKNLTKHSVLAIAVLLVARLVSAQPASRVSQGVMAADRVIDWTRAGAGTIPTGRTVCFTYDATVTAATLNTKIATCADNTKIQLNAGHYTSLAGQVRVARSNITIVGAGPQTGGTWLDFAVGDAAGCSNIACYVGLIGGDGSDFSAPTGYASWTAGYAKGATSVTIGPTTALSTFTKPQIGKLIFLETYHDGHLRSQDTTPETFSCLANVACIQGGGGTSDATRGPTQAARVTSITGDATCSANCVVGITPPLYIKYRSDGSGGQKVYWPSYTNPISGVGIEDLRISVDAGDLTTCSGNSQCTGSNLIGGTWVFQSWVKGVQVDAHSTGRMIHFSQSQGLTFRSNYVYRYGTNASYEGSDDVYGFNCYTGSGHRYENNIVQRVRAPFVQEQGCPGSVYVNNRTINNRDAGQWHIADWTPHGWSAYTLIEGEEGFAVFTENFFAQALFTTVFRSRLYLYDYDPSPVNQTSLINYGLSRHTNLVGNILGTAGYHTGYEMLATGNTTHSGSDCVHTIYVIGLGSNCSDGDNVTWPYNDVLTATTLLRWGNWDVVTSSNVTGTNDSTGTRWTSGEVPTGLAKYKNLVPRSHNLPASLVNANRPAYWPSTIHYPAIGPDVSSGNIANSGGHAYRNPASQCAQTMGLTTADTSPGNFTPSACYPVP